MDDRRLNRDSLEEAIGYRFTDRDLLMRAMTHSSLSLVVGRGATNQRLEFLGDAVLGLVLAEALFLDLPNEREGELTLKRSMLVSGGHLSSVARRLGLGSFVQLSESEVNNRAFEKDSVLEDVLEALIGAVYLDSDLETVRERILAWFGDWQARLAEEEAAHNPKGRLQELLQPTLGNEAIEYRLEKSSGPDHRKEFTVSVLVRGKIRGTGSGSTKKDAEEAAARVALRCFMEDG